MIAVRILLKSCATPPASWPTACILVACATSRLSRRLLAIVLEAEQHRGVAEPARAGDGQRDRLVGMVLAAGRRCRPNASRRWRSGGSRRRPRPCPRARRDRRDRAAGAAASTRAARTNASFIWTKRPSRSTSAMPERQQRDQAADVRGGAGADRGRPLSSSSSSATSIGASSPSRNGIWRTRSGVPSSALALEADQAVGCR